MKTLQGIVTSIKNEKTAIITVTTKQLHPLYKKYVKSTKKYACHVEGAKPEMGETVTIIECRPMSKTKNFKIITKDLVVKKSSKTKQ